MSPFICDSAARLPNWTTPWNLGNYNKRTNTGKFASGKNGVCVCGKQFFAGETIVYQYGKQSGCRWCCHNVSPTAKDIAAFKAWDAANFGMIPDPATFEESNPRLAGNIEGMLLGRQTEFETYREMVIYISGMSSSIERILSKIEKATK